MIENMPIAVSENAQARPQKLRVLIAARTVQFCSSFAPDLRTRRYSGWPAA